MKFRDEVGVATSIKIYGLVGTRYKVLSSELTYSSES